MRQCVSPAGIALLVFALLGFTGCLTPRLRRELAAEYYNLGNAFFELKKYDRALTMYEKSLRYHGAFPESSYNLARVHIFQERYREATAVLRELLAREPDNLILLQTLAYARAKSGDVEEAILHYNRVLGLSEGNIITLYNLSLLYDSRGEHRTAYDLLKKAVGLFPDDSDVLRRIGFLEAEYGSRASAINYLRSYREKKADDVEAGFFLAGLYKEERLYAAALELVEALAARKQDDAAIRFEQAYLLLAKAEEKGPGLEVLAKAADLGFSDKDRALELLIEVPSSYLQEVKALMIEKGLLTGEEADEALAKAFEDD